MTESNKKLVKDMKLVLSDLEAMLHEIKGKTSQDAAEFQDSVVEKLERTKEKLIVAEQDFLGKEQIAAEMTDSYVRDNAWKIIVIIAVLSFFIGYFA